MIEKKLLFGIVPSPMLKGQLFNVVNIMRSDRLKVFGHAESKLGLHLQVSDSPFLPFVLRTPAVILGVKFQEMSLISLVLTEMLRYRLWAV